MNDNAKVTEIIAQAARQYAAIGLPGVALIYAKAKAKLRQLKLSDAEFDAADKRLNGMLGM